MAAITESPEVRATEEVQQPESSSARLSSMTSAIFHYDVQAVQKLLDDGYVPHAGDLEFAEGTFERVSPYYYQRNIGNAREVLAKIVSHPGLGYVQIAEKAISHWLENQVGGGASGRLSLLESVADFREYLDLYNVRNDNLSLAMLIDGADSEDHLRSIWSAEKWDKANSPDITSFIAMYAGLEKELKRALGYSALDDRADGLLVDILMQRAMQNIGKELISASDATHNLGKPSSQKPSAAKSLPDMPREVLQNVAAHMGPQTLGRLAQTYAAARPVGTVMLLARGEGRKFQPETMAQYVMDETGLASVNAPITEFLTKRLRAVLHENETAIRTTLATNPKRVHQFFTDLANSIQEKTMARDEHPMSVSPLTKKDISAIVRETLQNFSMYRASSTVGR